jgi:hypothetical protein
MIGCIPGGRVRGELYSSIHGMYQNAWRLGLFKPIPLHPVVERRKLHNEKPQRDPKLGSGIGSVVEEGTPKFQPSGWGRR